MKKIQEETGLIQVINSVIEKHRDALSTDEIQSLKEAIDALKKLENSDSKEYGKLYGTIAFNLLKFFADPETLKQLIEWFNN